MIAVMQCGALYLPVVSQSFQGAAHTGALFLLTFVSAMAAIVWRNLTMRDMLVVPILLLIVELALWGFSVIVGAFFWPLIREFVFEDMGGAVGRSVLLQSFACFIIAIAVLIRKQSQTAHARKAADDFDEQRMLFDILMATNPQRDISFYRMQRLHERSRCIVGVEHGKPIGSVCMLLWEQAIILFDWSWVGGTTAETKAQFVRQALARPENLVPLRISLGTGDTDTTTALNTAGFQQVDPSDIDTNLIIQKAVAGVRVKEFPEWAPLHGLPTAMKFIRKESVVAA